MLRQSIAPQIPVFVNIVDGMEKVLACTGDVYQSGSLLTSIKPNPETGGVEISPLTKEALTKTLSSTSYPLIWLGHPDPATSLIAQVTHDPDAESLGNLMHEWFKVFGSKPTTVRKVVEYGNPDLLDALSEFPCVQRGSINP